MNQFQLQLAIAKETLAKADPILAKVISIHGPCKLRPHNNYFQELVSSIISQQLSTKAAATVWYRFLAIFNDTMPTPNQVLGTKTEVFRSAGLSCQKCLYIKDLAVNIENKNVIFSHLTQQSNNDIIEQITKVKGIGLWSAQMFLIFSLGRLDVLPCGDYGIRKSASELYKLNSLPNRLELEALATKNRWRGYESVVAWYLWKNLDNKPALGS